MINTGKVASFIENVIVGTEEKKRYNEIVEKVVKRLVENDLYLKLEKYKCQVREVGFLGVVIGLEKIKIEEEKMKKVLYQLTSKGVKNIQKFLRLVNYYWQFRKDFLFIARLLHNLVKKYQKWNWIEKQKKAFRELKKRFTKEPVLAVLNLHKKIRMEVNALDYTIEGILSMECEDRK